MDPNNELQKHYGQLLGIGSPWDVKTVELKLADKKVESGWVGNGERQLSPPERGRECSIHDCALERT